jgi:hypothetical protein
MSLNPAIQFALRVLDVRERRIFACQIRETLALSRLIFADIQTTTAEELRRDCAPTGKSASRTREKIPDGEF